MSAMTITVSIKLAWWVPAYIAGVLFMVRLTGLEPNYGRVESWLRRGVKLKVNDSKR